MRVARESVTADYECAIQEGLQYHQYVDAMFKDKGLCQLSDFGPEDPHIG